MRKNYLDYNLKYISALVEKAKSLSIKKSPFHHSQIASKRSVWLGGSQTDVGKGRFFRKLIYLMCIYAYIYKFISIYMAKRWNISHSCRQKAFIKKQ